MSVALGVKRLVPIQPTVEQDLHPGKGAYCWRTLFPQHNLDVSFATLSVPLFGQSRPRSEIAAWFLPMPIAPGPSPRL
jgi:hypothetical protein